MSKTLKIISLYAGERRRWPEVDSVIEERKILKYWIHILTKVNYGAPMDVLFVNNVAPKEQQGSAGYEAYLSTLNNISGKRIKNGKMMVAHRPNVGAMTGAYNYGFQNYKDKYDYFWFSEDDAIQLGKGTLLKAINLIKNSKVGFVCTINHSRYKNGEVSCDGNAGITSSKILKETYGDSDFEMYNCDSPSEQTNPLNHQINEHGILRKIVSRGYKSALVPKPNLAVAWRGRARWAGKWIPNRRISPKFIDWTPDMGEH